MAEKSSLSGNNIMLLLQLLSEKDMYGYEIMETLRERSENVFELKAGTLYPLLHSMELKNYLHRMSRKRREKRENIIRLRKKAENNLQQRKGNGMNILRL